MLKSCGPRIPETTASPPRINGVRHPPKQVEPNASLSVMQQQMTECGIPGPCISANRQPRRQNDSVKRQCCGQNKSRAAIQPLPLCVVPFRDIGAVLAGLQHRLGPISEFQRGLGGQGGNKATSPVV